MIWCTSLMHVNVHRTILSKRSFRALSVLVISLTKNSPLRHHAAEGNYYFLAKSNKRLSDTLVYSLERWNSWPLRVAGRENGRNKRTRETIPFCPVFRSRKSPGLRTDEWQVRPFLESRVYPGSLMRYFIGHNLPFAGRPFVLEKWKWCARDMDRYISFFPVRSCPPKELGRKRMDRYIDVSPKTRIASVNWNYSRLSLFSQLLTVMSS